MPDFEDDPFQGGDFGDFGSTEAFDGPVVAEETPAEPVLPDVTAEDIAAAEPDAMPEPESTPEPESEEVAELPTPVAPTPQPEPAEPAPEPVAETEPADPPAAEPEPVSEPEEAPAPSGGKKRQYVILQVMGPGKFEQVSWLVDKDDRMVPKGTSGARRQTIAAVHGPADALKVGHAALGSPTSAVRLVAVAKLHFQPKTIEPAPVDPVRMKLSIS